MAIIGIVAVDLNNGIGKEGQLLFHIKEDMEWFKQNTLNKTIVMGRITLLSLPGGQPLPNRVNVVLSSNSNFEGCINVHSIDEILNLAKTQDIYIIGGASLYKEMLPYYDEILVTKVYAEKDADTFFPQIDLTKLELVQQSDIINTKNYNIQFIKYKRKKKKEDEN